LVVAIFCGVLCGKCWESALGQEAFRLVALDALISLLLLPSIEVLRALLFK
jgi:hypothetical protein